MPVNVHCPECMASWVLDDSEAGREFSCPACMRQISVATGAAAKPAVAAPRPPDPKPDPAASGPTNREGDEVVCPRCQLHFYPRGRETEKPAEKRHTILIVEDQEYFRQIAADALEPEYEIQTAEGNDEARKILAQGGIDLLVLDLTLDSGDDGGNLLRGLAPKPCPILIFTAQDESELYGERWDELSRLGADDLVMKGMQVGESLRKKVRLLLGYPAEDDVNA